MVARAGRMARGVRRAPERTTTARSKSCGRAGGFLGALGSLIVGVIGTALGGPLVGAAMAGAVGTFINGGTVGDVLFAAGF